MLRRFGLFWYDFIVGDDWRIAVGVVITLAIAALAAHAGLAMWWFVPLAVAGLAAWSLHRATRRG